MHKREGVEHFDFVVSLMLALFIHAGILFGGSFLYSQPEIIMKKGESSIKMTLVASRPSIASKSIPQTEVIELPEKEMKEEAEEESRLKLPVKEEDKKKDNASVSSEELVADLKEKGVVIDTETQIANLYKPQYPEYCRKRGQEGAVTLEFRILADGKVDSIRIMKSSGYIRLDRAAVKALKRAKFIPARRMGVAVTTMERITFRFILKAEVE